MHTARAPSASALTMSVPRRKPEIDQHRDAAVDRLDDLGQRIDGRAPAVLGAAAVVGDDDGVEAVVDGEDGVLGRHQSLQHQPLFTVSRRRLMNSQVRLVAPVLVMPDRSSPSKLGLRLT